MQALSPWWPAAIHGDQTVAVCFTLHRGWRSQMCRADRHLAPLGSTRGKALRVSAWCLWRLVLWCKAHTVVGSIQLGHALTVDHWRLSTSRTSTSLKHCCPSVPPKTSMPASIIIISVQIRFGMTCPCVCIVVGHRNAQWCGAPGTVGHSGNTSGVEHLGPWGTVEHSGECELTTAGADGVRTCCELW